MEKIGLLVDSTTMTRHDLEEYPFIKQVQLKVHVDDEHFDEKDIAQEDMLRYLKEGRKLLTSQPSPAEFLNAFKEFHKEGYTHVITIVLSHKISGTYQSALIGKSMIDFDIIVDVHSPNSASFGVALGVKQVAETIAHGNSYDKVTGKYHNIFKNPTVVFTLGDLMNLFRGGRLSRVQALLGKILRVKPVIEMIDGKLELVKKERTNVACMEFFLNKIEQYTAKYKKVYLDIINIDMLEWGTKLLEEVKTKFAKIDIHLTDYLSPVFYTHLGDKGFGIAIVAE